MRPLRRISGFTLIELLVVITVIVVLLAMLAPALEKAIGHAERVQCAGNLHGLAMATTFYLNDFKRTYPDPQLWALYRPDYLDLAPTGSPLGTPGTSTSNPTGNVRERNTTDRHSWHTDHRGMTGIAPADDPAMRASYPGGQLWAYVMSEKNFMCRTFSGTFTRNHPHFTESSPHMIGGTLTPVAGGPSATHEGHSDIERNPGDAYTMHAGMSVTGDWGGMRLRRASASHWTSLRGDGPYPVRPSDTLLYTEETIWGVLPPGYWRRNDTMIYTHRSADPRDKIDTIADYHVPNGSDRSPLGGGVGNVAFLDAHVSSHLSIETTDLLWPGMLPPP